MRKKIYKIPYAESIIGFLKLILYAIAIVSFGLLLKIFEKK